MNQAGEISEMLQVVVLDDIWIIIGKKIAIKPAIWVAAILILRKVQ